LGGFSLQVFPAGIRSGNTVALSSYGVSVFDIKKWAEVQAHPDIESIVTPRNRLYVNDDAKLSRFDFATQAFKPIMPLKLHGLYSVFDLGTDELLAFEDGFCLPESKVEYPIEQWDKGWIYVIPRIGIGFTWDNPRTSRPLGMFLSARGLKPLCEIRESSRPADT
jgi:hypothetical protein